MQVRREFRSLHRVGQILEGKLIRQTVASLVGGVPANYEHTINILGSLHTSQVYGHAGNGG